MTAATLLCGSCGTQLSATAKFCNECGASIAPATQSAEYKQVTVLFADVVHSMDIAAEVGALGTSSRCRRSGRSPACHDGGPFCSPVDTAGEALDVYGRPGLVAVGLRAVPSDDLHAHEIVHPFTGDWILDGRVYDKVTKVGPVTSGPLAVGQRSWFSRICASRLVYA
jgi:zinc-ribbon domain